MRLDSGILFLQLQSQHSSDLWSRTSLTPQTRRQETKSQQPRKKHNAEVAELQVKVFALALC